MKLYFALIHCAVKKVTGDGEPNLMCVMLHAYLNNEPLLMIDIVS